MPDIYNDTTYLSHNPTWHEEDAPFKTARILKLLGRHPAVPRQTVCEVGCGSGEILVQLARQLPAGTQLAGYDISEPALAIARPKATPQIRFELRDLTGPAETEVFDLLLVIDVIEHLENYFDFLRKVRPRARYTVFHIPLDMSVWSLLREDMLLESKARVGHIHNFTEDFILSILAESGYRVIDTLYTEPVYKVLTTKARLVNAARAVLYRLSPKFCTKTLGGYSIMVLAENKL